MLAPVGQRPYGLFDNLFKRKGKAETKQAEADDKAAKKKEDAKQRAAEEQPEEQLAEPSSHQMNDAEGQKDADRKQEQPLAEDRQDEAADFAESSGPETGLSNEELLEKVKEREQTMESLADEEFTQSEYQKNKDQSIDKLLGKAPKLLNKVRSQIDVIDDVELRSNGTVKHNVFTYYKHAKIQGKEKREVRKKGPKIWPSLQAFKNWRANHLSERREAFRDKLTPLQYYATQGMGYERPFTGEHWWTKDVGIYSCVCCTQRVFMSDHKYESKSGYPTFWNHIIDAVDFKNDGLTRPEYAGAFEDPTLKNKQPQHRIICSNCESTLGHVYNDGPAPFFKRFQANDAALVFTPKPWFTIPEFTREQVLKMKELRATSMKGRRDFLRLLDDEKALNIPPYRQRVLRDKYNASVAAKKKKETDERKEKQRAAQIKKWAQLQEEQPIVFDAKGTPQKKDDKLDQ